VRLALNKEDAESIISHPDIYPCVSDDGSVPPDEFEIPEGMTALVVYDPKPVACVCIHWRNTCMCELHVQVLPDARNKSVEYGHAMLAWIWDNMPVDKLVGLVHDDRSLLYTLKLGFKEEGESPASLKQNGRLINQTHIGMERCQQQSPSYPQY
jgi:hypothetical protein